MLVQTDQGVVGQNTSNQKYHPRILVVDDDESLLGLLCEVFKERNFDTVPAQDGDKAIQIINAEHIDLVILDLGIPGKDGFDVLEEIRSFSSVPVIILSGRKQTQVKVACLNLGADDYITKPFANDELVARCLVALRHRRVEVHSQFICVREIQLDINKREVMVSGTRINLTRLEYELLKELMINAGTVVHYDRLIRNVWGTRDLIPKDYIHVYIGRLRSKLKVSPYTPVYIEAISGIGYMFRD
jgi:two-component system, OmpR family, KDP operon response regulator KdpE